MSFDIIFKDAQIVTHTKRFNGDIAVKDEKIVEIGDLKESEAKENIDLKGLCLIPGVIDTQVHFREPGLEHKEDLYTGTKSAILGGITGVFEMPNTDPSTTDEDALMDKFNRASNRAFCDYAFYAGGTEDNADNLPSYEKINGCCGVKVFMGASTGSLLVAKEEDLDKIVSKINYRASFHCEDQSRLLEREKFQEEGKVHTHEIWRDKLSSLIATQKLVSIAEKYNKKVHVLHVTTEEEINFLSEHKKNASVEITPQHLTLHSPDCYDRLGSYAQMNPPIRSKKHQDRLWEAINEGIADIIGSDHAPHTKEEKNKNYPLSPSGMPGVQTLVPVMLNHITNGKLSLERFIELTSYNPSILFGIKNKGRIEIGCDADFTVIDLSMKKKITNDWIASKCGWTPYEGMSIKGWPVMTIIRGHLVMNEGKIIDPIGKPMSFER